MDGQQSEKREKFEKEVAAHPFLLGMNEQHVRLLADCAIHSHFHTDGIVFREAKPPIAFISLCGARFGSNRQLWANRFRLMRYTMEICWGGRGFSRPTPGTSPRARWKKPTRFSFTARFCGSTARKITPSASSSSGE